ncbi:MAG: hypothetical protein JNL72_01060 [Flavipsychrobacter sp.]|nr:hypothetical protein [Flavipsychrobacter sp.]
MKKLVAYIFLFIFSFQVLPVKELGKMLFKNQLTEEIKEADYSSSDKGEDLKLKKEGDPLMSEEWEQACTARIQYLSHFLQIVIHEAERLPHQHVGEIFTPPPNYCA